MKRILTAMLPIPAMAFIAWAGGYDFDQRNVATGYMALIAMVACAGIYFAPSWKK